jgi:pimeloyl-ACP methyl ester carboxylesterase
LKEKIVFKNSKGVKLCGILSDPLPESGNSAIILCHGFSTSKEGRTYTNLEEIFNSRGLATFRFDFFGHGESEGEFEDITITEAVDDVLQAVGFIKRTGYGTIGLVGSSFGGMASIFAASQTTNLFVLALKSPVSDYMGKLILQDYRTKIKDWEESGFIDVTGADGQSLRLNFSFFEDARKAQGYEAASKIQIPTLIVHGDRDKTIPVEQSLKSSRLIKNCRLEIVHGADHFYSQPRDFEKMLRLISDFVIEKIKNYTVTT